MPRPTHRSLKRSLLLASVLTIVGCGSTANVGSQQAPLYPPAQVPERDPRDPRFASQPQTPSNAEMQRILAKLESLEIDNEHLKRRLSEQYMASVAQRKAELEAKAKAAGNGNASHGGAAAVHHAGVEASPARPAGGEDTLANASRRELLDALIGEIVDGKDPHRIKALMVAAISVASPRHELDHRLLDDLDPRAREQVARFHQMLAVTYDQLAGDPGRTITRREMVAQIDKVFGTQPLSIETLALCRRVDSYGVYQPFATTQFLGGRTNRVLVYVELENFHHEPTEDGRYEVKLEQSVEVYDALGQTTVLRHGPEKLTDTSRRKRRDFFIVYPVNLPARLAQGTYRLKVRLVDMHTGSICEKTLHDIKIVADTSLVKEDR